MITTTAYLDLSRDNRDRDRKALLSLYGIPHGTHVIVFVGSRNYPDLHACSLLGDYVLDLHLDITGDPDAVEAWSTRIREGRP